MDEILVVGVGEARSDEHSAVLGLAFCAFFAVVADLELDLMPVPEVLDVLVVR